MRQPSTFPLGLPAAALPPSTPSTRPTGSCTRLPAGSFCSAECPSEPRGARGVKPRVQPALRRLLLPYQEMSRLLNATRTCGGPGTPEVNPQASAVAALAVRESHCNRTHCSRSWGARTVPGSRGSPLGECDRLGRPQPPTRADVSACHGSAHRLLSLRRRGKGFTSRSPGDAPSHGREFT